MATGMAQQDWFSISPCMYRQPMAATELVLCVYISRCCALQQQKAVHADG